MEKPQTDCRYFSGYKPCSRNETCSEACPSKEIAHPYILIIHLEALGAVLRATAILPAIKKKWPLSHITWVTSGMASPLLENNPLVDRLIKNNHDGELALSTLSFDFTFCIDKSLVAAGLMELPKKAGERRGFGVEEKTGALIPLNSEAHRLWELGLSNHEKFFVNKKPETQLITEALGLPFERAEYIFQFSPIEEIFLAKEKSRLKSNGVRPKIGFNTGCSQMLPHKRLSVEGWTELINLLTEKILYADFFLLGGPEDTERNELIFKNVSKNTKGRLINTPTTGGLRNGLIYVALCDLVVTGDSLGMHMAIALKKWTISWFGPSCLHEIDFYERGEGIKTEAQCSPCWKRQCEKPVMCYDLVNFQKIATAVERGLYAEFANEPLREKTL